MVDCRLGNQSRKSLRVACTVVSSHKHADTVASAPLPIDGDVVQSERACRDDGADEQARGREKVAKRGYEGAKGGLRRGNYATLQSISTEKAQSEYTQ